MKTRFTTLHDEPSVLSQNYHYLSGGLKSGRGQPHSKTLRVFRRMGGRASVLWPTDYAGFSYAGYVLQSTTSLVSPVWSTVSPGPVVIGGENVVINTISGRQQFYRLSQ